MSFVLNRAKLQWRRYAIKRQSPNRKIIAIGQIMQLGDIAASEPIARYVRQQYPDSYIIWCVKRTFRELIDYNPFINETLVVTCISEWMRLMETALFDEVLDLHIQGLACHVCRNPLMKKQAGNPQITFNNYYNVASLLKVYCLSAGLPVLQEQPKVYIPQAVIRSVNRHRLHERFVVIHCTSNAGMRDWTKSKWEDLVERIANTWGLPVVEVGLRPVADKVASHVYTNLCGRLSILETAEVIRRARLFVGIDSGPAHLANAVGTFGIILLGHFWGFRHYMPYCGNYSDTSKAILIYEDGPVAEITVDRVFAAVADAIQRHELGESCRVI